MTERTAKPVTVTLGALTGMAQSRVASGRYSSLSEVVRAGLRALEREEETLDAIVRARVQEALVDPAPSIPQDEVFDALRAHHARRTQA